MSQLRVMLLGAGRVGRVHGTLLAAEVGGVELAAVVDPVQKQATALAEELEIPQVFDRLETALSAGGFDAAVITTPTWTHCSLMTVLARAGVHVFCEKPMACTLAEADAMLEAAEQNGVICQIGFMRRFDEEFCEAAARVEAGAVGSLMVAKSTGRGPGLPPEWALDPERSLGMLGEVGSHDFDAVRWMAASPIELVYAVGGVHQCPEVAQRYPEFRDTVVVVGECGNGTEFAIDIACPVQYGYDARMELLGTKGMLLAGDVKNGGPTQVSADEGVTVAPHRSWRTRFARAYRDELVHFVTCARSGAAPRVGGAEGREALAAVLAALESLRRGVPVRVQK